MYKKKIAFVVAAPITAHAFLLDHIVCLMRRYEVHLIANFAGQDELKTEFETFGIMCHQVGIMRKISFINDLKALFTLYMLFRGQKFESVHSVTPKAGLHSACAGRLARVPHRVHIFTGQVWCTHKGVKRIMLKMFDKLIVALDTNLLVDGVGQRKFLIQEGVLSKKNSMVLANGSIAGIKLDRYIISDEVRSIERERFGFVDDNVVFIFLGRLNHDKGIGEIYEAFNRLVVECPKARLLFYGMDEDGYDQKVEAYPNIRKGENYFFPGLTRTPYMALQCGDVFVIPTKREGFGVSVLEAQALGLPVITSNCYGVVDASVEGQTGLRCGVSDVDGLYNCMRLYYDNEDLRKQHGLAGRKRVEELFDNVVVSQAWLNFYEEILGE